MKTILFDSREDWLKFREGKITGSIANDVFSVKEVTKEDITKILDANSVEYKKSAKKDELKALVPEEFKEAVQDRVEKKLAYYQLMADRLCTQDGEDENEDPLDRGNRLESIALDEFAKITGKRIQNDLVMWVSDDHESITYSPDGVVSDEEVAEVKCLKSAMHLYIYFEKDIPTEYRRQNLQAFITNEKLKTLHFVLYDPRNTFLPLHYITINREDIADEIEKHKQYQLQVIKMLEQDVISLSF